MKNRDPDFFVVDSVEYAVIDKKQKRKFQSLGYKQVKDVKKIPKEAFLKYLLRW